MFSRSIILSFLLALVSFPAAAYVGPGPGLSMIGSFFTLVAGIAVALLMVLIWPIRLMLKRRKQKKSGDGTGS